MADLKQKWWMKTDSGEGDGDGWKCCRAGSYLRTQLASPALKLQGRSWFVTYTLAGPLSACIDDWPDRRAPAPSCSLTRSLEEVRSPRSSLPTFPLTPVYLRTCMNERVPIAMQRAQQDAMPLKLSTGRRPNKARFVAMPIRTSLSRNAMLRRSPMRSPHSCMHRERLGVTT
jgi:hypothetical protein